MVKEKPFLFPVQLWQPAAASVFKWHLSNYSITQLILLCLCIIMKHKCWGCKLKSQWQSFFIYVYLLILHLSTTVTDQDQTHSTITAVVVDIWSNVLAVNAIIWSALFCMSVPGLTQRTLALVSVLSHTHSLFFIWVFLINHILIN